MRASNLSYRPLASRRGVTLLMAGITFAIPMLLNGSAMSPDTAPRRPAPVETFDLLRNIHDAHLDKGGLIIPFDNGGHHKYSIGDWHHAWRYDPTATPPHTTLLGTRGELRVRIAPPDAGEVTIGIQARAGSAERAELFINKKYIGAVGLPRERFGFLQLPLSATLVPGENIIELLPKPRVDHAGVSPSMDLALIHFANLTQGDGPDAVSEIPEAAHPSADGTLVLTEGTSLSYNVFLRRADHLAIETMPTAGDDGELEISVASDDTPEIAIEAAGASPEEPIDIPLDRFSRQAVTVTLRAVGGAVRVAKAELRRTPAQTDAPPPKVENVVLVLVDTLRRDRLKTYNRHSLVETGSVDRLAKRSLVFRNAFSQSNWTKPAVASLLTGLYPRSHTATTHDAALPKGIATLPAHLQAQGIATAGFSANGYITSRFGFGEGWNRLAEYGSKTHPTRGRYLMQDAIRWMTFAGDQRFFAYIHTVDVHAPYRSPFSIWRRYDSLDYRGVVRQRQTASLLNRIRAKTILLNLRDRRRLNALYNGAISYHDKDIGFLTDALRRMGRLKDTAVIFTSDHGEEFFDHGSVGHGHSLYEELVHVPLMVRLPSGVHGEVDAPVGLVDLLPTLCEWMQVGPPPRIQGRSFANVLDDDPASRDLIISESPSQKSVSIRHPRFKAIMRGFEVALYDLFTDPGEDADISGVRPITRAAMVDRLGGHLKALAEWDRQRPGHETTRTARRIEIDAETKAQLERMGYLGE